MSKVMGLSHNEGKKVVMIDVVSGVPWTRLHEYPFQNENL
jgi:hypothetical protein